MPPRGYNFERNHIPCYKVPRIVKVKSTPVCSVSLIATKLRRLAAPGKALENMFHALLANAEGGGAAIGKVLVTRHRVAMLCGLTSR